MISRSDFAVCVALAVCISVSFRFDLTQHFALGKSVGGRLQHLHREREHVIGAERHG